MAGLWYRVGTISVTNGSKKVIGFGTQFKTGTYKPDKGHTFWGPDGKHYEVDYVESDTVLYLVQAYTGATAAGQSYEIDITRTGTTPALSREVTAMLAYAQGQYDSWQQILTGSGNVNLFAPDGQSVTVPALSNMLSKSGNLAGLAEPDNALGNLGMTTTGKAVAKAIDAAAGRAALGAQAADPTLAAIAGLTGVADRVPFFNGPDTAALAVFTAFARTLLDDADDTVARATLKVPVRTNAPGELNDISETGIYKLTGGNTSKPAGGNALGDHVLHFQWDSNASVQLYLPYTGQAFSWRRKSGTSWGAWFTIHTQETLTYEVGAFTPTIYGSATAGVGTYSVQSGKYTRIGNRVFIDLIIIWSAHTGTGTLRVGGLPFTSAPSTVSSQLAIGASGLAATMPLIALIGGDVAYIPVRSMSNNAAATDIAMDSAAEIRISGNYTI
jgi:hypothetical protein